MSLKTRIINFYHTIIQNQSVLISLCGTIIIWLVLLIFFAFYKPFPKKKFETIKITLASNVVSTTQKQATSTQAKQMTNKVASTKTSTTKSIPKKATQSKSVAKKPQKKAEYSYVKSVEELIEEQFSKKSITFDDDIIQTDSQEILDAVTQTHSQQKALSNADSLSKNQTVVDKSPSYVKSVNQTSTNQSEISSDTISKLQAVKNTKYVAQASQNITSTIDANVTNAENGKVVFEMSNGATRILLNPKKPEITISKENEKLLDSSRTVQIHWTVLSNGDVPFSSISFFPEAILPEAIKNEVKQQIATWRFSSANKDDYAIMKYTIVKL